VIVFVDRVVLDFAHGVYRWDCRKTNPSGEFRIVVSK
jgi:hypothetical protein